jgi:hypothetical protein
MAKKPKIAVTGSRRVLRPRNEAARALRETVYRPRVSKNPKAYSRKTLKKPDLPEPEPT